MDTNLSLFQSMDFRYSIPSPSIQFRSDLINPLFRVEYIL